MTWVRLDDTFPEHPKVLEAGGDAGWLHVCALAYCARILTDGLIPRNAVVRLSDRKHPLRLADRLVDVGIWDRDGDDYRIHDFRKYRQSPCGSLSEWLREFIIDRDGLVCGLCGNPVADRRGVEIDHIRPRAHGGTDHPANLQVSHARCNRRKGARV